MGSSPGWVKPKTMKWVFVAPPLSTQNYGERTKTGWLGIRIMCPSGATCLSADCCFSELDYANSIQLVGLVQSGPHHQSEQFINTTQSEQFINTTQSEQFLNLEKQK